MSREKNTIRDIAGVVWILGMLGVFIYFSGFSGGPLYDLVSGQAFRLGTFWLSLKYTFFSLVVTVVIIGIGGLIIETVLD